VETSQPDLCAGQWVEVVGQTSRGGFAPEITNATVTVLATTNLPSPARVDLEDLANGTMDARWVQLEGVVRRVTEEWNHLTLSVMTRKGRFRAVVPNFSNQPPAQLIDALVSVGTSRRTFSRPARSRSQQWPPLIRSSWQAAA